MSSPPTATVREALGAYLAENGFTERGYTAKWADTPLFGIPFVVPNSESYQRAMKFHDLHHVATGFGTDLTGEAEISAWELRRGLTNVGAYAGAFVLAGVLMGLLIAPRRTVRAWRMSAKRPSLFASTRSYEELCRMRVGELRQDLVVAAEGIADRPSGLHSRAPVGSRVKVDTTGV